MAAHKKKAFNTLLYFRISTSSSADDWKILHYATNYSIADGETEMIDVTTHSSLNNTKEYEAGMTDAGEFTASVDLWFNSVAGAQTGESLSNEAQKTLYNSRGTDDQYTYRLVLPMTGAAISAHVDEPPTDRPYFSGTFRVKAFSFEAPVDGKLTGEITFQRVGKQTFTEVDA